MKELLAINHETIWQQKTALCSSRQYSRIQPAKLTNHSARTN